MLGDDRLPVSPPSPVFLVLDIKIDAIHHRHETHEHCPIVAVDAVIVGVASKDEVGDRPLPAQRAEEAIEFQRVEGPKIEIVPGHRLELFVFGLTFLRLKPCFVRKGFGKIRQPTRMLGRPRAS